MLFVQPRTHMAPIKTARKLGIVIPSRRSLAARLGYIFFGLRSAFASICRMRSRVSENCRPTSSSVWSLFMPMPKRMRKIRLHPFLSCTPFDALLAATCEPLQLNKNRLPSLTPGPYVKFLSVLIQLGDRDCANERIATSIKTLPNLQSGNAGIQV